MSAVTAVTVIGVGLLHAQQVSEGVTVKVFVALDIDLGDFVRCAGVYGVLDHNLRRAFTDEIHAVRGVEVALLLEVILDVEGALVEQIVVDRALLKDRDQQLDAGAGELGSVNDHANNGALAGVEFVVHLAPLRSIGGLLQADGAFETVLLLIEGADTGERITGGLTADFGLAALVEDRGQTGAVEVALAAEGIDIQTGGPDP